jgi:hypothetical protein
MWQASTLTLVGEPAIMFNRNNNSKCCSGPVGEMPQALSTAVKRGSSVTDTEIAHIADNIGAVAVYPTGSDIIPPSTFACTKASDCANYNGPNTSTCATNFTDRMHGVCQGILPTLVPRTIELPPEISNDCDASTKTFAIK